MIKRHQPKAERIGFGIVRTFLKDRRANVLLLVGMAIIPLTLALGMGVDYSRAMKLQTKLNAIADAAALSGVSSKMMQQSAQTAHDSAVAMFNAQSGSL